MKTGLVLEGGAMRGLFTAGVIDVLMENGITFDGAIGVSAGACFGVNVKSHQIGRALRYNLKYAKDPRYASIHSWLTTGDFFNAEFCYHTLPEKLDLMDMDTFHKNPMKFYLVATDIESGKPFYYEVEDINYESLEMVRASASMPMFAREVSLNGHLFMDGGISDSIPLRKFNEMGYTKNIVVLTQPESYQKKPQSMMKLIRTRYRKYPNMIADLENRHTSYNEAVAYVHEQVLQNQAIVIQPDDKLDIGRIEHDRTKIRGVYQEGRKSAMRKLAEIKKFLSQDSDK
ncbi:MAG: patatin family protein [Erysipelotrichaceae bacterium]|nr:patatin family protein [Erysipelotrichaceae bacterium]MDY6034026.1 patatin family protein [Bulleidia sp.]